MAQQNSGGGLPPNFIANLPTVPQKSYLPHSGLNGFETLLAVVVPPKQSFTGSKQTSYG